jgi:hypothetical protein
MTVLFSGVRATASSLFALLNSIDSKLLPVGAPMIVLPTRPGRSSAMARSANRKFGPVLVVPVRDKPVTVRSYGQSAREIRRLPTLKRGSLRRSRMQVVRGVLRFSDGVVRSELFWQRPSQTSSVDTSCFLLVFIQAYAASENLLTPTSKRDGYVPAMRCSTCPPMAAFQATPSDVLRANASSRKARTSPGPMPLGCAK